MLNTQGTAENERDFKMAELMRPGLRGTLAALMHLGNRESNWYSVSLQKQ